MMVSSWCKLVQSLESYLFICIKLRKIFIFFGTVYTCQNTVNLLRIIFIKSVITCKHADVILNE